MDILGDFLFIVLLFGLVVFFLPRWIRTILAVVVFGAAVLFGNRESERASKDHKYFGLLHQGVVRLSTSLVKNFERGEAAHVSTVLRQLANPGTNSDCFHYTDMVLKLVTEQENTNQSTTVTTNTLTTPASPTKKSF